MEELLYCENITASTKAQDLFQMLNIFMVGNNVEWTKFGDVYTDDVRSLKSFAGTY